MGWWHGMESRGQSKDISGSTAQKDLLFWMWGLLKRETSIASNIAAWKILAFKKVRMAEGGAKWRGGHAALVFW